MMRTREEYIHKFLIIDEDSENYGKILELRRTEGFDFGNDKAYKSIKQGELFYKKHDIKNDELISIQNLERTHEYILKFRNRLNGILNAIEINLERI